MVNTLLRALEHRNYRLFFVGQAVSLIGTWLQQTAQPLLVYHLTQSPFWLGLTAFSGQIPAFFLAPVAGVLSDRADRLRTLFVTQSLMMVQAFTLAILTLTELVSAVQIVALSTLLGVVNAFDVTTRQAFLVDLIERREDLSNAIALNSMIFNAARLLGPALAGMLIATTGHGVCFLLNGLSYLAVLAALALLRVRPPAVPASDTNLLEHLREGIVYAFGFAPIRALLLLVALVSFVAMPYTVLLPVFAKELAPNSHDQAAGFLLAAAGLGALLGGVYLASRTSVVGSGRRIALAALLAGGALIAFSFADRLPLALGLVLVTGMSIMLVMASSNTVLQTVAEDGKRGRVISLFTTAVFGIAPLGSLAAGSLADRIGAENTVRLGGLCCLLGGLLFASQLRTLRAMVWPIYRQLGLLPGELPVSVEEGTEG